MLYLTILFKKYKRMFYCTLVELDALFSVIMLIIYGLYSLRCTQVNLADVYIYCRLLPIIFVIGYIIDTYITSPFATGYSMWSYNVVQHIFTIDMLLALLLYVVMYSFKSFESVLLLLFTFIGQYYMLHSNDLLTFYIALEAQNFSFLVLAGLPSLQGSKGYVNSVEASLKYFLLSAFSSGVLLYWFSYMYLQTGISFLTFNPKEQAMYTNDNISIFLVLCALLFKLGAAPLHMWMVQIYGGVRRSLLLYISTAPKLSLLGFWINNFQSVWSDYTLILFSIFSIVLGAFGAYSQTKLRGLLAFSTVNEIGLLISTLETAGFTSLYQHLSIYIVSQILLWNQYDKRIFTILAVSLAGLPPLAGFFGKAWIFWHLGTINLYGVLLIALACTAVSLVYYIRLIRLFWNPSNTYQFKYHNFSSSAIVAATVSLREQRRSLITSLCVVLLILLPIYVIKPFIM
jgi:NADH:ubiquinone oxidoreductase subunit 2 (subunit N)